MKYCIIKINMQKVFLNLQFLAASIFSFNVSFAFTKWVFSESNRKSLFDNLNMSLLWFENTDFRLHVKNSSFLFVAENIINEITLRLFYLVLKLVFFRLV